MAPWDIGVGGGGGLTNCSPPGVALTAMVINSARVTRLDKFMLPVVSPTLMPRALTTWMASSCWGWLAARAGRAKPSTRQAVNRADVNFFLILMAPFFIRGQKIERPTGP